MLLRSPWLRACALAPLLAACTAGPSSPEDASSDMPARDAAPDATLDATSDAAPDASPDAVVCTYDAGVPDDVPAPPLHTPRWAFEPWISKDISDTDDTHAFVDGFRTRDIPVGVVVLDSPWETQYNTFVPNPTRYHDFTQLLSDLHAQDIKLVLWITQMVNRQSLDLEVGGDTYRGPSPNYAEGVACGFFVDQATGYAWWKGTGAGVDFFNPAAVTWWHRQQDALLALGVDGWKLDFGDSYVTSDPVQTAAGPVPHQRYSEAYYHDFLAYGVQRRGADFATMVRPWDESYQFAGRFFARPDDAPIAWVGDNRRDWVGLVDALDEMFRSAAAGYVVLGSDIGGYLDHDDRNLLTDVPFSLNTLSRWIALGALTPFMELHGRANLTPWTVPQDPDGTVTRYRYWATLHHELVPFFYSLAQEAYRGPAPRTSIMRPVGDMASWAGDYRFQLGDALLVAPVLDDTGRRDVALPAGARWYDWWNPAGDALAGGQTLARYDATDLARIPLFVREGAIVPAEVASGLTGLGDAASSGALTLLVYPGATASRFVLTEQDDSTTEVGCSASGTSAQVTLARAARTTVLRVRRDGATSAVSVNGAALSGLSDRAAFDAASSGWWVDTANRWVWVKLAPSAGAVTVSVAGG